MRHIPGQKQVAIGQTYPLTIAPHFSQIMRKRKYSLSGLGFIPTFAPNFKLSK
jgi:hypothetical protein